MATSTRPATSHEERTAEQPRDAQKHLVIVDNITEVNSSIRLLKLKAVSGQTFTFLPGQWLDTFVPGIHKAGGFTITSPPHLARLLSPYIELAVQRSPTNPPAAWLFQSPPQILGRTLKVRVGGSFIWPPRRVELASLRNVVFVAGGVGINPLMSIVSHLASGEEPPPFDIDFMYSTKTPPEAWEDGYLRIDRILFLARLLKLFSEGRVTGRLSLFLTGDVRGGETGINAKWTETPRAKLHVYSRRIGVVDLEEAVGSQGQRKVSVAYVCGVPAMTDAFTEQLISTTGLAMERDRVLFEKWW